MIVPAPFGAEEQNDYHWASQALLSLESCDPLAAKAWYKLTEISANPKMSLKEALQLEMHVNLGLMKGRLARMAALPTVNRDGSSFAKAEVHGSIAARLATVSAAEVDEIFENSPVSIPKKKM